MRAETSMNIVAALKKEQAQLAKKLEGVVAAIRSIGWWQTTREGEAEDERCSEG
jgi:phage gp16-like protein